LLKGKAVPLIVSQTALSVFTIAMKQRLNTFCLFLNQDNEQTLKLSGSPREG
jgi:hypothetical protein